MKPEEEAREKIDKLLKLAGWEVQDFKSVNLGASKGVAVREYSVKPGSADYMLIVNRQAVGVVEAKAEGTTLSGVAEQSAKYAYGFPENIPHVMDPLPFTYQSTGTETYFKDLRDPNPRSRRVFAFRHPEYLEALLQEKETLRKRLKNLPELITDDLWHAQVEAIINLEKSLAEERPRALIQMATGSGKTFTAVNFIYRLIKFAKARRILFLVDRRNLGKQTLTEFQSFVSPDDHRKLPELYIIQHMSKNVIDTNATVCITTIQRLYSMLEGKEEFDESLEEQSIFEISPYESSPREVTYNPKIPIEAFDFIITDECHRSIYNLWRQVLEYFDSFIIGLTATPSKQTLGFFNSNLVMEYPHERAVADGVNVSYEVYRVRTEISEKGGNVPAEYFVDVRDRNTRKVRWQKLNEDLEYDPAQLDRSVVVPAQIRMVIRTFKERLFTELFPGRTKVPKTLIFAKDDSHAEDIVQIIKEEFGEGDDFCKKITYKVTGEKPEDLIAQFRNSYYPRIAVTVDMISTGTDIKPVECVMFMRDVKSRILFEQMKGRGTRTISVDDLQGVTPDAAHKTHFIIIDAVGVCENDKTDSKPLERKRSVSFDRLIQGIALGARDEDSISSLAGRLAALDKEISTEDRKQVEDVTKKSLKRIVNELLDAIDADKIAAGNQKKLIDNACEVFDKPEVRQTLSEIKKKNEQIIDTVSNDSVTYAGFAGRGAVTASRVVKEFKKYIEQNKDEITAIQFFYSQPYSKRKLTLQMIKELCERIKRAKPELAPLAVWAAYEQLEKVNGRPMKELQALVSLLRRVAEVDKELTSFDLTVNRKFKEWVFRRNSGPVQFTEEQMEWLRMIRDHIATSFCVEMDDFELTPFQGKGGAVKASRLFGADLNAMLEELSTGLAA